MSESIRQKMANAILETKAYPLVLTFDPTEQSCTIPLIDTNEIKTWEMALAILEMAKRHIEDVMRQQKMHAAAMAMQQNYQDQALRQRIIKGN